MTEPSPDHNEIQHFYDDVYYDGDKVQPTAVTGHLRHLAQKMPIVPGQSVLDVACGRGEWLMALVARGAVPHGLDISQRAIAVCQQQMPQGEFHAGVAESLPFADDQFALVSCLGSLEHFLDPLAALREMVRVAKPDATLLLLVPNADFLTHRLGLYRGTNQADVHEVARSKAEWEALFAVAGLQVQSCWRDLHIFSWRWLTLGRWWHVPLRAVQALSLLAWPLRWQYQLYFLCRVA